MESKIDNVEGSYEGTAIACLVVESVSDSVVVAVPYRADRPDEYDGEL